MAMRTTETIQYPLRPSMATETFTLRDITAATSQPEGEQLHIKTCTFLHLADCGASPLSFNEETIILLVSETVPIH